MSTTSASIFRWHDSGLQLLDYCDPSTIEILAADSWLVVDGRTLAVDLHRERFMAAVARHDHPTGGRDLGAASFWAAVLKAIPTEGNWFPRVELQNYRGVPRLVFRQRMAPELTRSVRLATHTGPDPRTEPTIKGPDTAALLRIRTEAQQRGADEAVILSPDGFVVEGTSSALVWWRGGVLCVPSLHLDRVDSVTAKSLITLAGALGVDVHYESVAPEGLDGLEVWSLGALHGIRIVTAWIDGPSMAEEPGRLAIWRARLDRLRKSLA